MPRKKASSKGKSKMRVGQTKCVLSYNMNLGKGYRCVKKMRDGSVKFVKSTQCNCPSGKGRSQSAARARMAKGARSKMRKYHGR